MSPPAAQRTICGDLEEGALGPVAVGRPRTAPADIRTFIALGDSFTAGTGCEPGDGWADRLATSMRRERPRLLYRNLASEGATTTEVLEGQLSRALEVEPDLATLIAGANDVLQTVRPRPEEIAERLARGFDTIKQAVPGVLIVTATVPERWRFMRMGPRTQARVSAGITELNGRIRALAEERGMPCLDVAAHPGLADAENFAEDGLHPSPLGHARAAAAFTRLLQSQTGANTWVEEK